MAVAETFEKEGVLANVLARGEQLRALARGLQQRKPEFISDVRGWGLIVGIEIAESCPAAAADVAKALLAAGVLVVPAGPKVVRFVPPLIVSEAEVTIHPSCY